MTEGFFSIRARVVGANQEKETAVIHICGTPPDFKELREDRDWFRNQAQELASALRCLPGGTWDALYAIMTQEKAILLAVGHDWPEEKAPSAAALVHALGEIVNGKCTCDYMAPWATALNPHDHKDGCPYKLMCGGDPLALRKETQP